MANQKHLEILREGVVIWNQWRMDNPNVVPNLIESDLRNLKLAGINFRKTNLYSAKLNNANLVEADFNNAYLSFADLGESKLMDADLEFTNLVEANLRGADLAGSWMWGTILASNDLSEVKGLETVEHRGPSYIGIDTIYKSSGKIPEVFLRECGVPENFITYTKSLVGKLE